MRERLRTVIDKPSVHAQECNHKVKPAMTKKLVKKLSTRTGNSVVHIAFWKVFKFLSPVDYLIDMPNRKKAKRVCHVNLLKPYRRKTCYIYIFIHQYGSAQKENTNIQTKSSIKNTLTTHNVHSQSITIFTKCIDRIFVFTMTVFQNECYCICWGNLIGNGPRYGIWYYNSCLEWFEENPRRQ